MLWAVLVCGLALIIALPFLIEARRKPMNADARAQAPGQFATLSQGVTHYDWVGPASGPVVVCVHGLTSPSHIWRGLAQGLAKNGFRVLIYDLYGRGYSDRPPGAQTGAFHMRQLNDLLKDQTIEGRFALFGHSMGGAIATLFAASHPDRIRELVLLTPAGVAINTGATARFITRTPVIGDWLMRAFYARQLRSFINAERVLPTSVPGITDLQQGELDVQGFVPAVLSSMRGVLFQTLRGEHQKLQQAGTPVLAIWGQADPVIPLSAKDTLAAWNPDARQFVIDNGGHGLPYTNTDAILGILCDTPAL